MAVSRAVLDSATRAVTEGRFESAMNVLWDVLPTAQDTDDMEALNRIYTLATDVAERGSATHAANARRMLEGISALHRKVERSDANTSRLVVTTGNDLPGFEITRIIGPVFGLTVRSRDLFQQWGSKLKGGTVGGELGAMTEAMEQSRTQVLARMEGRARDLGANAIIAMRFDANEMAGMWTEIAAYGTAVCAEKIEARDDGDAPRGG